jgi:cell division protein FtsZ
MTATLIAGVGDGGCRALHYIDAQRLRGLHTVAINTARASLERADARVRLLIGEGVTQGNGTGGSADFGWRSAVGSQDVLYDALGNATLVYLIAAFGGGTGTGASPIIAQIARAQGARVVAIISLPFLFEGDTRRALAEQGLALLREQADDVMVVDAERLLRFAASPPSVAQVYGLLAGALAWQTLARVTLEG